MRLQDVTAQLFNHGKTMAVVLHVDDGNELIQYPWPPIEATDHMCKGGTWAYALRHLYGSQVHIYVNWKEREVRKVMVYPDEPVLINSEGRDE